MQYRQYGKDGPDASVLGFGAMRFLPRRRGEWGSVNFTRSTEVLRRAMAAGVNFIDSHHFYHGGLSETAIGKALKGWKGQRIFVQTKTPFYQPEPLKYFKKLIEEALEKLGVNCIDYFLHHSMKMDVFRKRGRLFFKLTDWAMKRGYIRHRGFSSHDTPENVRKFVDTGEFSVMLVSYNWLNPAMAETIAYAADRGMGVSVMNPVSGGMLAEPAPQVMRLLRGAKSAPEIALRYVLATPGVTLTLSGMNTVEQVDENTAVARRKTPMTSHQWQVMARRLEDIRQKGMLICSACGYCMPCPHGVDIPGNLAVLSRVRLLGLQQLGRRSYTRLTKHRDGDRSALACKECGRCLPKCPNEFPIIDLLAETAEVMG